MGDSARKDDGAPDPPTVLEAPLPRGDGPAGRTAPTTTPPALSQSLRRAEATALSLSRRARAAVTPYTCGSATSSELPMPRNGETSPEEGALLSAAAAAAVVITGDGATDPTPSPLLPATPHPVSDETDTDGGIVSRDMLRRDEASASSSWLRSPGGASTGSAVSPHPPPDISGGSGSHTAGDADAGKTMCGATAAAAAAGDVAAAAAVVAAFVAIAACARRFALQSAMSSVSRYSVSAGPVTQSVLATSRARRSLPVRVNRSPKCTVAADAAPMRACSALMPSALWPMSMNTSLPPLKAQWGMVKPLSVSERWTTQGKGEEKKRGRRSG